MKTIFKAAACTLFLCMAFTACDNFMNGGDVKDEIISAIDYNNAKSISILVQAEVGSGATVPSGKVSVKNGYFFEISFTEASGSSFVRWKAVLQDNPETEVKDGVVFEDALSPKTRVKISNDSAALQIIPECKTRIALDGEPTPKYDSLGVSRDLPINVTFKQKVDPLSFIFSQSELPQNAVAKTDNNGNIWAYTLDDQTFLKNISITNADGFSLAQYFSQPEVDENTGMILTIETDKDNLIPFNANETLKTVIVTLSENIQNKDHITMGTSKTWRYQINDSTRQKATIDIVCEKDSETDKPQGSVTNEGENEYSIGQKINLTFTEDSKYQFVKWEYDSNCIYIAASDDPKNTTAVVLHKPQGEKTIIKAVCVPRLKVEGFEPSSNEPVGRNSSIKITFNHELPQNQAFYNELENISITIGGTPVRVNFCTPDVYGDTVTFAADKNNMLEVTDVPEKTVSVFIPGTLYYLLEDGTKVSCAGNGVTYNYKINNTTVEKAYVTRPDENSNISMPDVQHGFSMNQKISISFDVKEGFRFEHWTASTTATLPEGKTISDYVVFEDENNPVTTITFLYPLDGIVIGAVCPELPKFKITINGSNGKFSPAKDEYDCIETYTYPVSFEPDRDYEFIKWEIYDYQTNQVFENGTYITIDNPLLETTKYNYTSALDDGVHLGLRPVIAERPQIISNSPTGLGAYKDSTIQILFDTDMDPESIYFSTDEIKALKAEKVTQFLPPEAPEGTKIYGYIKDGETYFKNIMIRNKNTQKNINNCFVEPFFENPSTLSISAYKKPQNQQGQNQQEEPDPYHKVLDDYTQILVCLEKGFFYKAENDKPVEMAGSKKWMYQVNNKTDTDSMKINKENEVEQLFVSLVGEDDSLTPLTKGTSFVIGNDSNQTKISDLNYIKGNKFHLNFTISDPASNNASGSGPSDYFVVNLKRIYDSNYTKVNANEAARSNIVYYHNYNSSLASYEGNVDISNWVNIEDGTYAMSFTFYDRSNNSCTYPSESNYYYITVDRKGPAITDQKAVIQSNSISTFNTSWGNYVDLKQTEVFYKKATDTEWTSAGVVTERSKVVTAPEEKGINVDFKFVHEDYNGNKADQIITKGTKPNVVTGIRTTDRSDYWILIEWDAPEGECDGYVITYTDKDDEGNPEVKTLTIDGKNTTRTYVRYYFREMTHYNGEATSAEKVIIKVQAKYQEAKSDITTHTTLTGFRISLGKYTSSYVWYRNFHDSKDNPHIMYVSHNRSTPPEYWMCITQLSRIGSGSIASLPSSYQGSTIYVYMIGSVTVDGITETIKSDVLEFLWE